MSQCPQDLPPSLAGTCRETIQALPNRFFDQLQGAFGERVVLNGHPTERLPNTLNVSFVDQLGPELTERMPDVAVSAGAD